MPSPGHSRLEQEKQSEILPPYRGLEQDRGGPWLDQSELSCHTTPHMEMRGSLSRIQQIPYLTRDWSRDRVQPAGWANQSPYPTIVGGQAGPIRAHAQLAEPVSVSQASPVSPLP